MLKSALNTKSLAMFNLSSYGKRLGPDNFIFLKESSSLFLNKAWELLRGLTEYQRGAHFKTSEAITFSRHLSLHGHWNRKFSVVLGSVRLLSAHSSVHKKTEMPQFVNVRRIMLGHKRAAKSPLLQKFIEKCVKEKKNNFVSSMDVLNEYKHAVELWTEGDNQAKILLKEKAFQRVSLRSVSVNFPTWCHFFIFSVIGRGFTSAEKWISCLS